MKMTAIDARDLPDAWFQCVRRVLQEGHIYEIDRGSYAGQQRQEFDFAVIRVMYPGSLPMVPDVPLGIPVPATTDQIDEYMTYLMTSVKKVNEQYTYGEDLKDQIPEVIRMYKEDGHNTNQAFMAVGNAKSIFLEDPQCLRGIDTRVRYGALHFYVYFRSWDLWGGFPVNLGGLQILKNYMAGEIGVKDGELIAMSKGLHLYDHCWEPARLAVHYIEETA